MLQILRDANALQGSLKYNYDAIDADVRPQVIEAALDIRQRINRAQGDLIATGQKLSKTKELLPHGQFESWVETEFGFSQRTAQNLMNVAERFTGKSETVSLFSDSALYLLAAPSTPAAAIDAAAAEATATGASPTKERVKEIIAEHKPARVLDAKETEAAIWRAVTHHAGNDDAKRLEWLENSHITDHSAVLNPSVRFDLQTHADAYGRLRNDLSQRIKSRAIPQTAQNSPKTQPAQLASINTPASAPSRQIEASTPATAWAERAKSEPVPLTYLETRKLIIDAMMAVSDDLKPRYQFLMDMTYWRDWLDRVPAGRTLDSEVHAKAWRDLIAVLKAELGLDDYGRPAQIAQGEVSDPTPISEAAQRLLNGTTADRLFLAKALLRTTNAMMTDLSVYGQLTGKFLDIPPAERALRQMRDQLQSMITALGG